MTTSFDAHVEGQYVVSMDKLVGTVALVVEADEGNDFALYFPTTADARVFLAQALAELRRIERGDLPYNVTDDRIEVKA